MTEGEPTGYGENGRFQGKPDASLFRRSDGFNEVRTSQLALAVNRGRAMQDGPCGRRVAIMRGGWQHRRALADLMIFNGGAGFEHDCVIGELTQVPPGSPSVWCVAVDVPALVGIDSRASSSVQNAWWSGVFLAVTLSLVRPPVWLPRPTRVSAPLAGDGVLRSAAIERPIPTTTGGQCELEVMSEEPHTGKLELVGIPLFLPFP